MQVKGTVQAGQTKLVLGEGSTFTPRGQPIPPLEPPMKTVQEVKPTEKD